MSAFPESENQLVAKLALDLLCENTSPQTLSLVAEANNTIVGHIAFSPVEIEGHDNCQAYILAPLAVLPDYQRRRIGSSLIKYGMQQILEMGTSLVFVYGDPVYYGRFGFNAEIARNYKAPYQLQYPFGWQAITTNECAIEKAPIGINCVPALCAPELW